MRVDFTKAVAPHLIENPKNLFLTGDLGFNAFEDIKEKLGKRFLNLGVAEQNMIGVAAGLALEGFTPWVYSIATFATYRCFEQIRNDVCLHNLPVRLVGNGGGYTYGVLGSTHHAIEDLGILKTLPHIQLFFPAMPEQVSKATKLMNSLSGPSYLRLGITSHTHNVTPIYENPKTLTACYQNGSKALVIGVGHTTQVLLEALKNGLLSNVEVWSVSQFPVVLEKELLNKMATAKKIIFVEEHNKYGSISESLSEHCSGTNLSFCAVDTQLKTGYGSIKYHLEKQSITPAAIAAMLDQ